MMSKGLLCDGCGDKEPAVYCEECKMYFCEECDAYLHSGSPAGAKVYEKHVRKSIAEMKKEKCEEEKEEGDALKAAVEKALNAKRDVEQKIEKVKAAYSSLSAEHAKQSKEALEQTVGAYLAAIAQTRETATAALAEAKARRDFLKDLEARQKRNNSSNSSGSSNDDDDECAGSRRKDDDDDDDDTRAALLAIARMSMTAGIVRRLDAATKAADDLADALALVKLPEAKDPKLSAASAAAAAEWLLNSNGDKDGGSSSSNTLIYDDHFFSPPVFSATLDFGVAHTTDSATGHTVVSWKTPRFLETSLLRSEKDGKKQQKQQQSFLVELRGPGAQAHYKVCSTGSAHTCTIDGLEPGLSYEVRVTALGPAMERLPYTSSTHTIPVPSSSSSSKDTQQQQQKGHDTPSPFSLPNAAKRNIYTGYWDASADTNGAYEVDESATVITRKSSSSNSSSSGSGSYVAGVCGEALPTVPGCTTTWGMEILGIDPATHLYVGVRRLGADPLEGAYFCVSCGALKSGPPDSYDHKDVPECPKGSLGQGAKIGFEFLPGGSNKAVLAVSVNSKRLSLGFTDIPLDSPLVPAVVCVSGKVRILG